MDAAAIRAFQEKVYDYYHAHGRVFPWRDVTNPYDIAVSEIMLQQTQADRVAPKYQLFMQRWPLVQDLAAASQADVLAAWSGLGYNRRALMLHRMAKHVTDKLLGQFPRELDKLVKLPGIGPYTAAAIMAFAYNQPAMVNETNIRSVIIHEFFADREGVTDKEVVPFIEATMDKERPREWYQALMDYGAMLKRSGINPSRRSAHYVRQSPLKGSNREARGAILKALHTKDNQTSAQLTQSTGLETARIKPALEGLCAEGFLEIRRGRATLAK